jgi:hypothetical protein
MLDRIAACPLTLDTKARRRSVVFLVKNRTAASCRMPYQDRYQHASLTATLQWLSAVARLLLPLCQAVRADRSTLGSIVARQNPASPPPRQNFYGIQRHVAIH